MEKILKDPKKCLIDELMALAINLTCVHADSQVVLEPPQAAIPHIHKFWDMNGV